MDEAVATVSAGLARQRPFLYRYALLRLRRTDAAEDVVQDTFVAALEGGTTFRGESALRTWLAAILKHKISDWHRREARNPRGRGPASGETEFEDDDTLDKLFDAAGNWVTPPSEWPRPDRILENREFYELLERSLAKLPPATARAFRLREIEGLSTREISAELGISESNCCVMLHRARVRLRQYLEDGWALDDDQRAHRASPRKSDLGAAMP